MAGALALATLYEQNDNKEKAIDALMLARALGRAEKLHNPRESEIKK